MPALNMLPELTATVAERFAVLALANIGREYPHKLDHVMAADADAVAPRLLHPAFHGSYDWHSCVHMHWLLARLRRRFPGLPNQPAIDALFDGHFASDAIAVEVAYLARADSGSFERPYGWAWLLKLAAELRAVTGADGRRWSRALRPLADAYAARYVDFLPRVRYPFRYGLHANSAFALAFALDYARIANDDTLADTCVAKAREWYAADRDAPARWEPSGVDFLSPTLIEAELMRRILDRQAFAEWLGALLPVFVHRTPAALFEPADVVDRGDPQLVHLDGLNLSRAWCFRGIAAALPAGDPRIAVARDAAWRHLAAGWRGLVSDEFVGAHWLASFAVLALEG
ncbi:MAG: DUF2891 domain-containing protein [Casimicrobiaceae bacterium]|nr:DUF2891 domain-containing protein [Pseudomonadota bacterium]